MQEKITVLHADLQTAVALYGSYEIIERDIADWEDADLSTLQEYRGDLRQALHYLEKLVDAMDKYTDALEDAEAEAEEKRYWEHFSDDDK